MTKNLAGMKRFPAGRLNDGLSLGLSASLAAAGFKLGRLQTGTPARLDRNTIDFNGMAKQEGDATPLPFSYLNREVDNAVRQTFSLIRRFVFIFFCRPIRLCAIRRLLRPLPIKS